MTLQETKLSRLYKFMDEYETATITAFRHNYNYKENLQRNRGLLAKLQREGYNIIQVKGKWVEGYGSSNPKEVSEDSFFVVNANSSPDFVNKIRKLGEDELKREDDQDSVMIIDKGGSGATLWGTSRVRKGYPPYGESVRLESRNAGHSGISERPQFFTSKKNKFFYFESSGRYHYPPKGMGESEGVYLASITNWKDFTEKSLDILIPMEFVGKSRLAEASWNQGFWAFGNKVYEVNTNHVRFIIDHLESFNLTREEVEAIYNKYNEKFGTDNGRAREEIIKEVSHQGWVRIRHYMRPDFWSIQCDNTTTRRRTIKEFIDWAIENKQMYWTSAAVIEGYDNPEDRLEYPYQDGGIEKYILD